jgi:hypothetical protein
LRSPATRASLVTQITHHPTSNMNHDGRMRSYEIGKEITNIRPISGATASHYFTDQKSN